MNTATSDDGNPDVPLDIVTDLVRDSLDCLRHTSVDRLPSDLIRVTTRLDSALRLLERARL